MKCNSRTLIQISKNKIWKMDKCWKNKNTIMKKKGPRIKKMTIYNRIIQICISNLPLYNQVAIICIYNNKIMQKIDTIIMIV